MHHGNAVALLENASDLVKLLVGHDGLALGIPGVVEAPRDQR